MSDDCPADSSDDNPSGDVPPKGRKRLLSRGASLLVAAVSLYLVGPSVLEVFSSRDQLRQIEPWWFVMTAGAQLAAFASLWSLQRLALRAHSWLPVITSQLAGNAAGRIVPGGAATSTAVQFRLLRTAGVDTAQATSGLAAAGLLQLGVTFALPVIALPSVLLGAPVPPTLLNAAWLGAVLFVLLFSLVAAGLTYDGPLRALGRLVDAARRALPRLEPTERAAPDVLVAERDSLIEGLDGRWGRAALLAVSRSTFDFVSLMTALAAFGVEARASLVLLAFASSQLLGLVPLTPGGLGFVEAGLTASLSLAGVSPSDAVAVTLLYRLFSFWAPIPVGMLAAAVHHIRFGDLAQSR